MIVPSTKSYITKEILENITDYKRLRAWLRKAETWLPKVLPFQAICAFGVQLSSAAELLPARTLLGCSLEFAGIPFSECCLQESLKVRLKREKFE